MKFYHTVSVSYFLKKDVTQFKDMRKRLGKALCWKKKRKWFCFTGHRIHGNSTWDLCSDSKKLYRSLYFKLYIFLCFKSLHYDVSLCRQSDHRYPYPAVLWPVPRKSRRKAVLFYMQDRSFHSFASNMIKLSVNETKWSSLLARTRALILNISIWIFDFEARKVIGTLEKRASGEVWYTGE